MKRKLLQFLMLVSCRLSPALVQAMEVTRDDALYIAKQQFRNKAGDYFILEDDNEAEWTMFVDSDRMKCWEHDCYVLTIPKRE